MHKNKENVVFYSLREMDFRFAYSQAVVTVGILANGFKNTK